MKAREIASLARNEDDEGPPMEVTAAVAASPSVKPATPEASDPTAALLADLLGVTTAKATRLLQSLGGLEALAFASEAALRAASIPPARARLIHVSRGSRFIPETPSGP